MQMQTHYLCLHSCLHTSVGEGEGGERQEGAEVGGGGDGYCGYHGYGFVMGHKIVTRTRTCAGKGVIPATGYPYPCSSLIMAEILTVYSFQKDSFSHVVMTKPNTDVRIVLDDNTTQTLPRHKVAIFQDRLELMWDFCPHFIEVLDNAPEDALVITG